MLGRKKNPSPQEENNFRASIKSYYEEQIRKKRLSNETQFLPRRISNEQELEHHLSQLELREIEKNTVNSLRSRLSANKTSTSPNRPSNELPNISSNGSSNISSNGSTNISISPVQSNVQQTSITKSPTTPIQSILKSSATVKETKSKVTFSQIQPKQQIPPPNKAQVSPFLINSQPKLSNQLLFTPQQKPIASVGAFNAVGTPISPPQASPIAQSKPTNTVFPQFSTPLQQPPTFVQNVAPVQRKQAIQRPVESLNLSSSSNTSSNSSSSSSAQLSNSLSPKSAAPVGVATNITPKLPDNLPLNSKTPAVSMKPTVASPLSNVPSTSSSRPTIVTTALKEEQPGPSRQRRPSKSETPESSKFSHWVRTHLAIYEENMHRLREFRSNHAILPICNRVRMAVQEIIDIHTSEDPNDIKSISAALIFFQDLFKTGAAKKGDQPLPLIKEGKLFMLMCICDRYLKRVVGQDSCTMFIATLFIVLMKNEPQLFTVFVSLVLHKCILPRLDTNQCLRQVLNISNGPAEQSAQWLNEEQARFKLLVQICALTTTKTTDHMQGQDLIRFLLTEATSHAPSIPIATPFVLNTILSIDMKNYRKNQSAEFANLVQKARSICDLNWSVIIRTAVGTSDFDNCFTDRALTLMATKNAVLIQNLKTTISSIKV